MDRIEKEKWGLGKHLRRGSITQPMLKSQLSVLKSKMIGKFGEGINCMSIN